VQAQHELPALRALVDVVQPEYPAVTVGDVQVVRSEGIAEKVVESSVRRAENLHELSPYSGSVVAPPPAPLGIGFCSFSR
jgi:hypothetical protein